MKPNPTSTSRPADFKVQYEWQAGTVPPPFHDEYTIRLGPDPSGEIIYSPDYPNHNPPVWRETFPFSEDDLTHLFGLIVEKRVLTRQWLPAKRRRVGGSQEWLDVTAEGTRVSIPSELEEQDAQAMQPVYDRIRALVPQDLWKSLEARRQTYQEGYVQRR